MQKCRWVNKTHCELSDNWVKNNAFEACELFYDLLYFFWRLLMHSSQIAMNL